MQYLLLIHSDETEWQKLTAGGSAILEVIFPGNEHEMETLYHVDGGEVVTHCGMLGDAPRMKRSSARSISRTTKRSGNTCASAWSSWGLAQCPFFAANTGS